MLGVSLVVGLMIAAVSGCALAYMDDLATIDVNRSSKEQSSYDRVGGNWDNRNYLYVDGAGDRVLLDVKTPGRVKSIWCTGFAADHRLKVYIDGEATPRINILLSDLFSGRIRDTTTSFARRWSATTWLTAADSCATFRWGSASRSKSRRTLPAFSITISATTRILPGPP